MKALNWFQACALGKEQKRAVRREGWRHWIFYRFYLWIRSETGADGREVRRVVTATDFRDSEFLAKDWTDEPWEGATTPPCTTLPPATMLGAGSGGLGTWTRDERCAGDGEGGGITPPYLGGGGSSVPDGPTPDPATRFVFGIYPLVASAADDLTPHVPLVPDSGGCWVTAPTECDLAIVSCYVDSLGRPSAPTPARAAEILHAVYVSATGVNLTDDQHLPFIYIDQQWGILGPDSPYNFPTVTGYIRVADDVVVMGVIYRAFPYSPGTTITVRTDEGRSLEHAGRVHLASYTFPPLCSAYP